jgi:hypothetical protein
LILLPKNRKLAKKYLSLLKDNRQTAVSGNLKFGRCMPVGLRSRHELNGNRAGGGFSNFQSTCKKFGGGMGLVSWAPPEAGFVC